jgi:hypothetical protein
MKANKLSVTSPRNPAKLTSTLRWAPGSQMESNATIDLISKILRHIVRILLLLTTVALSACSVSDGARTLVIIPNIFNPPPRDESYACEDKPVEAYIKGRKCTDKAGNALPSPISRSSANDKLPVLRGGCALMGAMWFGRPDVFDELISNGAEPKRCVGYPSSLYNAATLACKENPEFANRYFSFLEKSGTLREYPQVLLYYASLSRCVEGVQLALRFGALANAPIKPRWDGGQLLPMELLVPLESSLYKGTVTRSPENDQRQLQIVRLLIDAGGNPWAMDSSGKSTIYEAAESSLATYLPTWPSLRAILLSSPLRPLEE